MSKLSRHELDLSVYSHDALTDLTMYKSVLHVPSHGDSLALGAQSKHIDGMVPVDLMIEMPGRSLVLARADAELLQVTAFGDRYPETGRELFVNPVKSLALYRENERNARWSALVEPDNLYTPAALTGLMNVVATFAPARQQAFDEDLSA
jgi:hypothetical protein